MRFGDVLDGSRHFINPLIYSVFRVLDGQIDKRTGQIGQNRTVRIHHPGMGIPVCAERDGRGLVGIGFVTVLSFVATAGGKHAHGHRHAHG